MVGDEKKINPELELEKEDLDTTILDAEFERTNEAELGEGEPVYADIDTELEEQRLKVEELSGRLVRLQADFDNYRRRSRKELEVMARFGSEQVILACLPIMDNFKRALTASEGKPELTQFATGMEMIYRQLEEALEKEGLAEIPATNELFDPERHHAVAQVETDEYEDNMIVDELQKGYTLHGKVLRHSAVRVAKNICNNS